MNIVLGGGLAGLSAAYVLSRAGHPATVIEKEETVGGLSKTISHGQFRFDLGGHRFLTYNQALEDLVVDLLGDDLLRVPRKSQIHLNGRYVDYPLTPLNAFRKLGLPTILRILRDYGREQSTSLLRNREIASLEDWVVANFGRTMFELYFKEYSEKVWGIDCSRISMEWVAQRIDGLSLLKTLKCAFFHGSSKQIKTLTDTFLYPRLGIGQLAEQLRAEIERRNPVHTASAVDWIFHDQGRIHAIQLKNRTGTPLLDLDQCISSIPLTILLQKMTPRPPERVLAAARKITFRSLVLVALFLDKERVTDHTWMYFPQKSISFGRIHEPKNWSPCLAPPGRTHLVTEYFCDIDDRIWGATDNELVELTIAQLRDLNFVDRKEVSGSRVLRIPYAYPVFDIDYRKHLQVINDYLDTFENLHVIGRSGTFSYLNMDHAMESGMQAAEEIMKRRPAASSGKNMAELASAA